MGTIKTDAWVLHEGPPGDSGPQTLRHEEYFFDDVTEEEVLVEPIYGCWEANMTHALERDPVDICRLRGEKRVVLGNAGVIRVLKTGTSVRSVEEGDLCCLSPVGKWNEQGYMLKVLGYDAGGTVGLLAKRLKLHEKQLVLLPEGTRYSYRQWAAFPVRYGTAWANWNVAYRCWRLQVPASSPPHVWGWGGGVALAELSLAKLAGCRVAMISSNDERLRLIEAMGIQAVDRREFIDLNYDEERYKSDRAYKKRYVQAQKRFLDVVKRLTEGTKVSIFIDNIGSPVIPATLRALGHRGIITSAGWKKGMQISLARANECVSHHIHVHTHGCPLHEGAAAVAFAEANGWIPPVDERTYSWDEIPQIAEDYATGKLSTYFPIYQINPL